MIIQFPDQFNPAKLMFQLELQYMKEGKWEPTVYPPTDYETASKRLTHYNIVWGNVHNYRIAPVK